MNRADKLALLVGPRDRSACMGLEIGARDAPLLSAAEGPVRFADYADTETLRANAAGTHIDPAALVPVDIVTGEALIDTVMQDRVDYIVASHVAEHVPDLLGWLGSLARVLRAGGTLGLAIPDRRCTFDICRQESSIAEAVEAYVLQWRRPSPRQIFDSAWQAVDIGVPDAWAGAWPEAAADAMREQRLAPAFDLVRRVHAAGSYNDAHCWVFTPASFLILARQAALLGLFPFVVEEFFPTPEGGYEFLVRLRVTDAADAATGASIAAALAQVARSPGEAAMRRREAASQAEEALRVMRASTSWRVTAPLRAAMRWWLG